MFLEWSVEDLEPSSLLTLDSFYLALTSSLLNDWNEGDLRVILDPTLLSLLPQWLALSTSSCVQLG